MIASASWYNSLAQPWFAPPASVFAPVWSVLYVIIAVSFGYVIYLAARRRIAWRVVLPFALNIVFNAAFTPIQFGLKNNALAAIDVLLVLVTLIWAMRTVYPHVRWVVLVNIPYLAWVTFATVLQWSITWLNR